MKFRITIAALLTLGVCASSPSLQAQEPQVPPVEETPKDDDQPTEKDESLLKDLLKEGGAPLPSSKKNPLQDVVEMMEQVQGRLKNQSLGEKKTGEETQKMQADIIQQLDELIKQAEQNQSQPPPQNQNPSPEEQPMEQEPMEQTDPMMPEEMPMESEQPMDGSQGTGERNRENEPQDSTGNVDEGEDKAAEFTRRQQRIVQMWGHLPPAIRNRILNTPPEEYLPQYEDFIRRYFDVLAEQEKNQR